jgi:DNA-binding transcriptional LysR family regulator
MGFSGMTVLFMEQLSMDLNEISVFARVVQAGSFTGAAAALAMPKSTVSRKVAELEQRLGAALLSRTTRKLSLTDAGRIFYDYCARIVGEVEDALRAVASMQATPRGLLRMTAGTNTTFLGPIVRDYLARHADVRIELVCTGRTVDLVEERFDLAIRAGRLPDSTLVARSLGSSAWFLVATPAYLRRRGRPKAPAELAAHEFLLFGPALERATLRLERGGEAAQVELSPRFLVNDTDILHAVTAAGLGIALLPAFRCVEDLRARRLERVLRDWSAPATPIHVVVPSTRFVSPVVKSFVEHLQARMTPPPWELGGDLH